MNITRNNYESYFIDYLDVNLSPVKLRELNAFLLLNPDLAEQLEELPTNRLKVPEINYPNKSLLRKDQLHACPDYYAIAATENILTKTDIEYIKQHTDLENNKSLYQHLRFKPDSQIKYPYKSKLHRTILSTKSLKISTVAAAVILLLGFIHLESKQRVPNTTQISKVFYCPMPTPVDIITISQKEKNRQNIQATKQHPQIKPKKRVLLLKENPEKIHLISFPLTQLQASAPTVTLALPTNSQHQLNITQSEIYLAESACIWKSSEKHFLSDNIFSSVINAGKILAEKIKTKEKNE